MLSYAPYLKQQYDVLLSETFYKEQFKMSLLTIITCLIAGIGAGVGTGFAGLSAAAFIGPLLIGLVGIPAYQATAIGLASDVLASAVSAWTYHKAGNIDRKNVGSLLILVLIGTAAGSLIAQYIPNGTLGFLSIAGSLFLGCQQLLQVAQKRKKAAHFPFRVHRAGEGQNRSCAAFGLVLSADLWEPAAA